MSEKPNIWHFLSFICVFKLNFSCCLIFYSTCQQGPILRLQTCQKGNQGGPERATVLKVLFFLKWNITRVIAHIALDWVSPEHCHSCNQRPSGAAYGRGCQTWRFCHHHHHHHYYNPFLSSRPSSLSSSCPWSPRPCEPIMTGPSRQPWVNYGWNLQLRWPSLLSYHFHLHNKSLFNWTH